MLVVFIAVRMSSLVKNSSAAVKSLFLVLIVFITAAIFVLHYWHVRAPLVNLPTKIHVSTTELNDSESVLEIGGYEHVIAASDSLRAEKVAGNVSSERDGAEQLLIHPPSQPEKSEDHLDSSSPPSSSDQILRQSVTDPPQQATANHLYSSSPPSSSSDHFKPIFRQTVTHPPQQGTVNQPSKRTGFILATYFWDQQTYSVGNILALQRWAAWLGVRTVEPFLVNTKFRVPFDDYASFDRNGSVSHMKMGTMYDIGDWNNKSAKLQFKTTPLMSWDYFLRHACRDVVYIEMMRDGAVCQKKETYVPGATSKTLSLLGFNIIKTRCVSLPKSQSVQLKDFKAKLYGNSYLPNKVTLILSEWSHQTIRHVVVEGSNRIIAGNIQLLPLKPSKSILCEAEEYKAKFLSPQGRYMSILVRTEWFYFYRTMLLPTCLKKATNWMRGAMNVHNLSDVFVGIDLGKYGSTTIEHQYRKQALELGENFLQTAYRDQNMTLRELEKTFEVIESQSRDPGYIAFLQKTVAVAGECLLLIGGGSFHDHALRSYKEHHNKHCYLLTDHRCIVKKVYGIKV